MPERRRATQQGWRTSGFRRTLVCGRIPAKEVEIGTVLSKTLKSIVYMASWRGTQVVAKTSSVLNVDKDKVSAKIVHEIQLLSRLRHPDLVMFLGACFDHDTPFLITEFM